MNTNVLVYLACSLVLCITVSLFMNGYNTNHCFYLQCTPGGVARHWGIICNEGNGQISDAESQQGNFLKQILMICSCIFITVCYQTPGTYINAASSSWTTCFILAAARREVVQARKLKKKWRGNFDNKTSYAVFAWLWLMAGADLLWENNTADWLVAGGWCWFNMREQYCWLVGWQAKRTQR